MNIELNQNLAKLGLELPVVSPPAGAYVGYKQAGNMLFIAGQLPMKDGKIIYQGKVGADLSVEDGAKAASLCALNIIAQINHAIGGDWSKFAGIIRLNGFVNCQADFTDHPEVINGASELMAGLLGEAGKHSRIALGASSLPRGAAVEIDAIIALS